ncbi:hypothetical protein D3C71_1566740 [compost metagenome]
MSRTMAPKSSRVRRSLAILRNSAPIDSGGSAWATDTVWPLSTPSWAKASSDRPSSLQPTMAGSSTTLTVARIRRPLARTSILDRAWKPSARYTAQSRCR